MAVAGYNLYVDGSLVASVIGTSKHVAPLDPGTYDAQVQAFDDSGNASALSSPVSFTVPEPETVGDTFPGLVLAGAHGELLIDTTGATVQGSEPWDDTRTLWGSWTAPATGRYAFDTLLDQVADSLADVVLSLSGLEGYWRLNEGGYVAVDDSNLNRHGVYLGGHTETLGSGELDAAAAQLDGATQRIQLPDAPGFSIGATGLTVCALLRIDDPTPPHQDVRDAVGVIIKPGEWQLIYFSSDADSGGVPGSIRGYAPIVPGDPGAGFVDTDYLATPTWVMVIATFDPPGSAGGVTIYRSNAQRDRQLYSAQPARPSTPQPITIGLLAGPPDGYFPGALSDVAIWSRVLDTDEIGRLYTEFAGVQNPVDWLGVIASGTATQSGTSLVLTFTHAAAVGDTLLLYLGGEYNPGGNTIFDSTLANDYHRVIKSHQDPLRLGKLVCYRCDLAHAISAGDTLTISPENPIGIRVCAVAHFAPLGDLDANGFALQTGTGGTPPASPAVHPHDRDDRIIAAHLELGPPGDTYNEDPDWAQQLRIGTTSFDAGVPVTRIRTVTTDAQTSPSGFPAGIVITNPGPLVPAGSVLHVRAAHTFLGAGAQSISGASATWTTVKTDSDPDSVHRHTWYRGVLGADWPTGSTLTIAGSASLTTYAVIVDAWTGEGTPAQTATAKGSSQAMTSAPLDPASLAGAVCASASWTGPPSDTIDLPDDWVELARAGTATLSLLSARPAAAITHQTTFNPDDLTGIRDWVLCVGYLPPAAPTGGPLTPHETNASLTLALLDQVPVGADVPYQPVLDPTPDPARKWITIVLSFTRP